MLFISPEFIFGFLPATLIGFFILGKFSKSLGALWLTCASFFFYGYWSTKYLWLLGASISFNFIAGWLISKIENRKTAKTTLAIGVGGNLFLLGYYKYANFFIDTINTLSGQHWAIGQIILPLGISFFTFTQIAFLVDAYRGKAREFNPIHYALFVTYFPHLIAGPILHHKQMMPQFSEPATYRPNLENFTVGLTIFIIGLFKKLVLADEIAPVATRLFDAAAAGGQIGTGGAWIAALAYTFQLYFDFSGYCDMAIGLSRLFGIQLPINFNSPYKSLNIIDFWRRWHITLSTFLRDYLYFSLGGNRKGPVRRYANLLLTMLLGGLWHGAGWTFVVWGGLHGLYLVINHAWRHLSQRIGLQPKGLVWKTVSWGITFLSVVTAWVYFRAPDIGTANAIVRSMFAFEFAPLNPEFISDPQRIFMLLGVLFTIALVLPNTQEFMALFKPGWDFAEEAPAAARWWSWRPSKVWAAYIGSIGAIVVFVAIWNATTVREFLYFQF